MSAGVLTTEDVAALLGRQFRPGGKPFTRQAIHNWRQHRGMPHFKVGNQISFDREQVLTWANKEFGRNQHA